MAVQGGDQKYYIQDRITVSRTDGDVDFISSTLVTVGRADDPESVLNNRVYVIYSFDREQSEKLWATQGQSIDAIPKGVKSLCNQSVIYEG